MPDTTEPEIKVTEDGLNSGFSLSAQSDQGPSRFPNAALRRAHEGQSSGSRHHQRSHSIDTKDRTSPVLGFGSMQADRSWSISEANESRDSDASAPPVLPSDHPARHGSSESSSSGRSRNLSANFSTHGGALPVPGNRKTSSSSSASGSSVGSPDTSYSPDSPRRSSLRADRLIPHADGSSARRNASPARHYGNSSPRLQAHLSPSGHVRRISAEHSPSSPYRASSPVYAPSSSPPTGPVNPDPQHSWDSVWPRSSTPDRTDQIRRLGSPAPVSDLSRRASLTHSEASSLSRSPSSDATSATSPQLGRPKARRPHELRGSSSSPVLRLSPTTLRESHEPNKSLRRSLESTAKSEPLLKVGFSPPSNDLSASVDASPATRVLSPVTEALPRLDAHHAVASHRANGASWPLERERPPSPASTSDPKKRSSAINVSHQLSLPNRTPSPRMSPASPRSPFLDPPTLHAAANGVHVPMSESPPKTRSFIAMPPRSGYELSDDPDDVGSEDGSNSERESVGTTDEEGEDIDDDYDEVMDEDLLEDEQQESANRAEPSATEDQKQPSEPTPASTDRPSLPKRPSLTRASVVPPPLSLPEQTVNYDDPKSKLDASLRSLAARKSSPASSMLSHFKDDDETEPPHEPQPHIATDAQIPDAVSPYTLGFDASPDKESSDAMDEDEDNSAVEIAEESLNTLERIFLFAKSDMAYHRVLVSQSLPDWIREVELNDAVEYIIPLLNGLATDDAEVCAAFAPEIGRVMWFFFRNCPLAESSETVNEASNEDEDRATRPKISISTFTTLLCALLLNQTTVVAGATQQSIVQLFYRLQRRDLELTKEELAEKGPDETEARQQEQDLDGYVTHACGRDGQSVPHEEYHFHTSARTMVMNELLENVALALAQISQLRSHTQRPEDAADESTDTARRSDGQGDDSPYAQDEHMGDGDDTAVESEGHDVEQSPARDDDMTQQEDAEDNRWSQPNGFFGIPGSSLDEDAQGYRDEDEEAAIGRMASVSLLSALAADDLLPHEQVFNRFATEILNLVSDPAFYVRKEVASALGPLSKHATTSDVVDKLLQALDTGVHDSNWHVRQAACYSLPSVLARLDSALRREKTLLFMRALVNDVSRQLRTTALEVIGETIHMFLNDAAGVPAELIRFFLGESFDMAPQQGDASLSLSFDKTSDLEGTEALFAEEEAGMETDADYSSGSDYNNASLLNSFGFSDNEPFSTAAEPWDAHFHASGPERPLIMAFNFPAVVLTVGQAQWSRLRHKHAELTQSAAFKVRKSLAASLHEVAKIVGPDATRDDLLPAARHFVQDDASEVRAAMLENIDIFLSCLPQLEAESVLRSLLDLWSTAYSRDWRLRETLALHIPSMSKQFLLEDEEGSLVSLMQLALSDPVSAVRDAGVLCVPDLHRIFAEHDQVIADGFLGMVSDLGDSQGYRLRVACLLCIKALVEAGIQRSSCELLLHNRLMQMGQDAVVDVRIVLAKTIGIMCRKEELYASPQSRSADLYSLIAQLARDNSYEVREPVQGILSEQELEKYESVAISSAPTPRLVLGPADGGPHRPVDEIGFASNFFSNDDDQDSHVFEMDDEEENDDPDVEGVDNKYEAADADDVESQYESQELDAEDSGESSVNQSQPADHLEKSRAELLRGKGTSASTMPLSSLDAGWLSSTGPTFFEYTEEKEGTDDEPHHLLGVGAETDDLQEALTSDEDVRGEDVGDDSADTSGDSSELGVTLSSPQRGADSALAGTDGTAGVGESSPSRSSVSGNTGDSRSVDPFLAFVAGRHSGDTIGTTSTKRGSVRNSTNDNLHTSQQKQKTQHTSDDATPMGGQYHSKGTEDLSELSTSNTEEASDDDFVQVDDSH